jgi:hypothetical protein
LSLVLSGGVQCGVPCISKNRHNKKKEKAAATGKKRDTAKKKAAHDKKKAKIWTSGDANDDQATHGPNYVPDKDEAIAMAFVAASEDGIDGTGKKTAVFQAEIFAAFKMKWAVLGLNKIIGPLVALAHNPKMVHSRYLVVCCKSKKFDAVYKVVKKAKKSGGNLKNDSHDFLLEYKHWHKKEFKSMKAWAFYVPTPS